MSLSAIFFSYQGRIGRTTFFLSTIFLWTLYFNIIFFLDLFLEATSLLIVIPFLWSIFALSVKRLHDIGRKTKYLLLLLIPVIGAIWVFLVMLLKKGIAGPNQFGPSPDNYTPDYKIVTAGSDTVINDVTQLNPVTVKKVYTPSSITEISNVLKSTNDPVSIGGGRFSMGGQVSSPDSIHFDMRKFNHILYFNPAEKVIRVQSGVRWCDIQKMIDPHELSVKIMQTYANFTVGGSLSVNSHGRYMGLGPLILSVRSLRVIFADGEIKDISRTVHPEIFFGVVGGYGGIAIIAEAELDLADNIRVERHEKKLNRQEYLTYFHKHIRKNSEAIFHNADIYPPSYKKLRAVTWIKTDAPVTTKDRLMPVQRSYPIHRYFYWAFSETMTGKWRREHIIEPLLYRKNKVHWRNYEAGYDVAELEPSSRQKSTYVLQEYFVPIVQFDAFTSKMASVLKKHKVNMINISVRHALPDPGTYLAWARQESFAFVLYYKQKTDDAAKTAVGKWTRELIDAVLSCDGTYYLPYQPHATAAQFHNAYPRAKELFALKKTLDPDFRFRNVLWNKYYIPND